LSELGASHDFLRCPRVFLGLLGPGTSDCPSLGHPWISQDVPRCPRFLGLLGPGTRDCLSLGHPGISQDVPSYGNHLSQVQVECHGTSRDIPRCLRVFLGLLGPGTRDCQSLGHSWNYLDLGQVIVRAWDIPRCPRFLGLLGPRTRDCQSFGHPGISQDVPSYSNHLSQVQVEYPGTSRDIPRCPRVLLGLLGPETRDCQSLGHHMIS